MLGYITKIKTSNNVSVGSFVLGRQDFAASRLWRYQIYSLDILSSYRCFGKFRNYARLRASLCINLDMKNGCCLILSIFQNPHILSFSSVPVMDIHWIPPPPGVTKINVHGVFFQIPMPNGNTSGI